MMWVLEYLGNHLFFLMIGIIGSNLTGSLAYGIWLLLSKGVAKFTVKYEMIYLRIVIFCYLAPMILAIGAGFSSDAGLLVLESWVNNKLVGALLLLEVIWICSVVGVFTYRYREYVDLRFICFFNKPIKDRRIWELAEKRKKQLGIHQKYMLFYNEEITSPGIIYRKGYQILLPTYELTMRELDTVFLHEMMHLKHGDVVTKDLAFVVNALFAFNPLTHQLREHIQKWAEVSCDWACNQAKDEEVSRREYFNSILRLKLRSDQNQKNKKNTMFALFEEESMLEFRVDMVLDRQEFAPQFRRVVAISGALLMAMLVFAHLSVKVVAGCREMSTVYVEEEMDQPEVVEEVGQIPVFDGEKVIYFPGNIIGSEESTDFAVKPGEMWVFSLFEHTGDKLVVDARRTNENCQCGLINDSNEITFVTEISSKIIQLDLAGNEKHLFIKNIGDKESKIELMVKYK